MFQKRFIHFMYPFIFTSTIMESAFGRLHKSGGPPSAAPPNDVDSIMVDGKING